VREPLRYAGRGVVLTSGTGGAFFAAMLGKRRKLGGPIAAYD
jgi:hypothetical protein